MQETVDEIIKYREYYCGWSYGTPCVADRRFLSEFKFPIARFGAPMPDSMISLGYGLPQPIDHGDPIQTYETQQLLEAHKAGSFRWDKEVNDLLAQSPQPRTLSEHEKSVMRRVPFGPSLLVEDPSEPRAQAVK